MDLAPVHQPDPKWATAVPDWEARIMARSSLVPELPLFDAVAEKALRVFKRLRVPDIFGQPTYGEACDAWTFDLVRAIFGSYDPELKRRMIREFFLLIPKKNGKSSIAAAIIVTAAILNERPEAELLLVAPTKTIAGIAFKQAKGIIALDAELTKLFQVQDHILQIKHRTMLAVIFIKAADSDVITGSKATYILIDETHVFAAKAKAAELFVEIRGSLASRPDGFLLQITTQSKKPPTGVFKAEIEKARDVRDGRLVLPLLALMYELPLAVSEKDGWKDPQNWARVNPNLGRSVDPSWLADELLAAERTGPEALALFASQHHNVQIGMAMLHDRWVGANFWEDTTDSSVTFESILARCEVVVAGIDGGGLDDLLGLTLIGRERESRRWLSWSKAWVNKPVLKLRQNIAPKLQELHQAGELVICETPGQDVADLVAIIEQVNEAGLLPASNAVGMDPEGIAEIFDALLQAGLTEQQMCAVSQGYKLNSAIKGAERKLYSGNLIHADQALMIWCVANAKTEQRGNAVIVTKAVSGSAKIDPVMALFNAVLLMAWSPVVTPLVSSPWDDPEFSIRKAG
ncbi:terminase large subunit [Candidatus Halocynthiibacter alkanivorans]|uniref:terminase large subunit n=1 Tax=Candidatus Halocynthiibacter alkanivorans TaxID=2267619 RepID=UPI000DF3F904|nr:terminase large subunit [Candidatus Halocynthiibacter alkanivorans]